MMGRSAQSWLARTRRHTSNPSISGINRSSRMRSGRRTASRWKACTPLAAGRISNPSWPKAAPITWMLDSWSSTTSRQPALVAVRGLSDMRQGFKVASLRPGQRGFNGPGQFWKEHEMAFHLADGVGVGQRRQGGGIGRQRRAVSPLAESEKLVGEGPGLVDREAVTQGRPLARFLAPEFKGEFPPLACLLGQRSRKAGKALSRIVLALRILEGRLLKKLRQCQEKRAPREGLAQVGAELALELHLFAGLTRGGNGDDRQRRQLSLLANLR